MSSKTEKCVLKPQEKLKAPIDNHSVITIGLPANYKNTDETRFLLTPEACAIITNMGYKVRMEDKAAINIHYKNADYTANGVEILPRSEVLKSDIVASFQPLTTSDLRQMKKGAVLLCFMDSPLFNPSVAKILLDYEICCICFDKMISTNGEPIFARILDEIDGKAAVMYAQEGLSFLGEGKGVLLSGIAGVNPCEVLIIGTGWRVMSAAKAAIAAGAKVTLMDNDISGLNEARIICGEHLITTAIHPRVLYNVARSADVIFTDSCSRNYELPDKLSMAMKESVYILDFQSTHPSLSVPRTVAMAISNVFINFLDDIRMHGGMENLIRSCQGVQNGVISFRGKLVDKLIGINTGLPCVDLQMMLAGSN